MMRIVTFKTYESLLEEFDKVCMRHGLSRSEALRLAMRLFVDVLKTDSLDEVRKIVERKQVLGYVEKIPIPI